MRKITLCQFLVRTRENIHRPIFNRHKKAVANRAVEILTGCLKRVKCDDFDLESIKNPEDVAIFAAITAVNMGLTPCARCENIRNRIDPEAISCIRKSVRKTLKKTV